MKKRVLSIILSLSLVGASLMGCSSTTNNGPAPTKEVTDNKGDETTGNDASAKQYRVAYIARSQSDSFAAWLANEMKTAAKGYSDITLDVFDGQADDEKENSAIENAITNGYDAIIVQPNNGEAQRPYVEKVVEAGIIAILKILQGHLLLMPIHISRQLLMQHWHLNRFRRMVKLLY